MNDFRLLKASEIECRVGQCGKSQKGVGWCSLLLYKDARCDQRLLDETFGMFRWQRRHEVINNQLCCTVSIKDEQGNWVEKQDVGVESNTEAVKGSFSDAFKRACFNWGLGRELYTAPKIFVTLQKDEFDIDERSKVKLKPKVTFVVAEIGYDDERNINRLVIVDKDGTIRYKLGENVQPKRATDDDGNDIDELKAYAFPAIEQANDEAALRKIWDDFPQLQSEQDFITKITERKAKVAA